MTLGLKLLLLAGVLVIYFLVTAILRTLGAWSNHHVSRHNLIVEAKRQRQAYFDVVAERKGFTNESIEILD